MKKERVLLVEDEEHILDVIKLNLELDGYHVTAVSDGSKAIGVFREKRFDIVILDIMLPGVDGYHICEAIRLDNNNIPILFLTAKGNSADRVKGLKLGADDYLVKPFNLEELLLRVKALLKRGANLSSQGNEVFRFGKNQKVNFKAYEITDVHGNNLCLSKREIKLLKLLTDRKNQVVAREDILETVWGYDSFPSTRTIDNYILAFRKYFEETPKEPRHFISVRGVGYRFSE